MQGNDAEAAFKQMKGQSRKSLNIMCFPGFGMRWQVWGHSAIECRAESLEGVEAALSLTELCLPRVWPLATEFDASLSFLHISAAEKLGLENREGEKFPICFKLK